MPAADLNAGFLLLFCMIIELSVLAAFGAMICWGFGDFFIQRSARKVGATEALAMIGILSVVLLFPFALQDLRFLFSFENTALLFFVGLITFVAGMLNFEALKTGKLSIIDVLFGLELPATVIFGIIFFREILTVPQIAIIALIFFGVLLSSLTTLSFKPSQKLFEKGVFLALVGAIAMAGLNFSTAFGSRQVSPVMAVWFPAIIFSGICLFAISRRKSLKDFWQSAMANKLDILGMGTFDTLAWLLFAIAVLEKELAITIAITESYPAIAILLGILVNKEKIRFHQFAGAAMALLGGIALAMIA